MPERSNGPGLGPGGSCLRGFESSSPHNMQDLPKHKKILETKQKELEEDSCVVGIYLIGSLARGSATESSDIDIEIIYSKGHDTYTLQDEFVDGIKIGMGLYPLKEFEKDCTKMPYTGYCNLVAKILYDPQGVVQRNLEKVNIYFEKNQKIRTFWEEKEKKFQDAKRNGKKAETYFEILDELEKKIAKGEL